MWKTGWILFFAGIPFGWLGPCSWHQLLPAGHDRRCNLRTCWQLAGAVLGPPCVLRCVLLVLHFIIYRMSAFLLLASLTSCPQCVAPSMGLHVDCFAATRFPLGAPLRLTHPSLCRVCGVFVMCNVLVVTHQTAHVLVFSVLCATGLVCDAVGVVLLVCCPYAGQLIAVGQLRCVVPCSGLCQGGFLDHHRIIGLGLWHLIPWWTCWWCYRSLYNVGNVDPAASIDCFCPGCRCRWPPVFSKGPGLGVAGHLFLPGAM